MPERDEQDRASAPKKLRVTRGERREGKRSKLLLYCRAMSVISEGARREQNRESLTLPGSGEGSWCLGAQGIFIE